MYVHKLYVNIIWELTSGYLSSCDCRSSSL
jgi:hypothetical protein